MTYDAVLMDLEKAMGRIQESSSSSSSAGSSSNNSSNSSSSASTVFVLQMVHGQLEQHHVKRMVQFLNKHRTTELSLFRVDLFTNPAAAALFGRYLRSAPLLTIRLRTVGLQAAQTPALLGALAEHGRFCEIVLDAAGLATTQGRAALPHLVQRNPALRKLDLSCEGQRMGSTQVLANALLQQQQQQHLHNTTTVPRDVSTSRSRSCSTLQYLSLNACGIQDVDALPLLQQALPFAAPALEHLELRGNFLGTQSLQALANLLLSNDNDNNNNNSGLEADGAAVAAAEQEGESHNNNNNQVSGQGSGEDNSGQQQDNNDDNNMVLEEANVTNQQHQPPQMQQQRKPLLKTLDLASNVTLFAGEEASTIPAIQAFCTALASNQHLTKLNLRNCGVTPYVLEQLAKALEAEDADNEDGQEESQRDDNKMDTTASLSKSESKKKKQKQKNKQQSHPLRYLDVREVAVPTAPAAATMVSLFPEAFWESVTRWKGVETLELDYKFGRSQEQFVLQALSRNISLTSGNLDGLKEHKLQVEEIFLRNLLWKRVRAMLADNHVLIFGSSAPWMPALAKIKHAGAQQLQQYGSGSGSGSSSNDKALSVTDSSHVGNTAVYCALRERLSLWLESRSEKKET